MLSKTEIIRLAHQYAKQQQSSYFTSKFLDASPPSYFDDYWQVSFQVLNESGNPMEGVYILLFHTQTGQVSTFEEQIQKS